MATAQTVLQRAYDNYARILVLVTEVIATPTRAGIDAVIDAASTSGIVQPKPTYTVDGEVWNWMEYQQFVLTQMLALEQAIQRAGGPYIVSSRGSV